jgi:hypothetical protein
VLTLVVVVYAIVVIGLYLLLAHGVYVLIASRFLRNSSFAIRGPVYLCTPFVLALLINTIWVTKIGLPVYGTVVNEESGDPIEGAAILVVWDGINEGTWLPIFSITGHGSFPITCYHAELAHSDAEGKFLTAPWIAYGPLGALSRVSSYGPAVIAYHADHDVVKAAADRGAIYRMPEKSLSGEDRRRQLEGITYNYCPWKASQAATSPFAKEVNMERDSLVPQPIPIKVFAIGKSQSALDAVSPIMNEGLETTNSPASK